MLTPARRRTINSSAATMFVALSLGLAACGNEAPEADVDTGDAGQGPVEELAEPYAGPYDETFMSVIDEYAGEEVTLIGEVDEVVNPVAFTVAGGDGTAIPPLLVVYDPEEAAVEQGDTVEVTGILHEVYNVPTAEEDLGEDPGEDLLAHYDGQPYIDATAVDSAAPEDSGSIG